MSRGDWTLTVRVGPKVEHEHYATLQEAAAAIAARLRKLEPDAHQDEVRFFSRRIEPEELVSARLELAGPQGERGGIDLRGDGSADAFSGRLRRRLIEQRKGESATDALTRALST